MEEVKDNAPPQGKKAKILKALGTTGTVLLYVFFALCVIALLFAVFSRRNSGAVNVFGTELRIVVSESMEECAETDVSGYKIKSIPVGSIVFIKKVPDDTAKAKAWYDKLQVGDVLTFTYDIYNYQEDVDQEFLNNRITVITHRLVEKTADEYGGWALVLEGDNRTSEKVAQQTIYTSPEHPDFDPINCVIGKVTGQSLALGVIVGTLQKPLGIALIIIVPCAIVIIMEAVRIGGILSSRKKEKIAAENELMAAENERQLNEIEELKRKLAALEGDAAEADPPQEEQADSAEEPQEPTQE